jgi:G3E family GTPase
MEAIITIVGFLGAGKTTVLKYLLEHYSNEGWRPFVILNDYENATIDAQQIAHKIGLNSIKPLSGSCICCSGIVALRDTVNRIPERKDGITFIEANGTSDACSLMEFLGVGLHKRFLPPIQISVVAVKNWQQRGEHNALEANQIQVSSVLILTHLKNVHSNRKAQVIRELKKLNPSAKVLNMDRLGALLLPELVPSKNSPQKFEHQKAHWASCSVDLPEIPNTGCIHAICAALPKSILRVKGCTRIQGDLNFTYFERTPSGEVHIRPFNGIPITGSKLLSIGPGSTPALLENAIKQRFTKV